mgnify:CR=1 FL=1
MNGYDVQQWIVCENTAKRCDVRIELATGFKLYDAYGLSLGSFRTVSEVYAFLCGYEQYHSLKRSIKND